MTVIIDGDASPVKTIIYEETKKRGLPVILVTSFAHFSNKEVPQHVEVVYVDSDREAADYRIMALAKKGDLLVTQDYGLASLALGKQLTVLHHNGFLYTHQNIDQLLESRYLNAQMRKSGKRTKGPKAFTQDDRNHFRAVLEDLLDQ